MNVFMSTTYEDVRCKKENPTVTDIVGERELVRLYGIQPATPKSEQFLAIPFRLLDSSNFRNNFMTQKRFRTYLWLLRRISRGRNFDDPASVYEGYYSVGKLAAASPLAQLAKALNISKSTVSDHLQQLANDGLIQIETVPAKETGDGHEHKVYILGTHDGHKERWFAEDVFLNRPVKEA
jgi:DNA-binding MarR family transcriptional regulator